jgi:FixJ family two-component response regulator
VVSPPVVAIVDDDPSVLRALHRVVEVAGYTVQPFASARECLDALARGRAACLILDIHLNGGMSGFELQERLAASGVGVPVIFITANDDARTRERTDKSGAAGYLSKPVDKHTLLEAIRRAIALGEGPLGRPDAAT